MSASEEFRQGLVICRLDGKQERAGTDTVGQSGHCALLPSVELEVGVRRGAEREDPALRRAPGAMMTDPSTQTATFTDARNNAWTHLYSHNALVKSIDPLSHTERRGKGSGSVRVVSRSARRSCRRRH
jgi:hypothetical protein